MSDVYLFKTLECYLYNYTPLSVIKTATDAKQTSAKIKRINDKPLLRSVHMNDLILLRLHNMFRMEILIMPVLQLRDFMD